MKECKVIVMGFGAVGQGVARAISLKKDMIKERFDVELKIVAAADSSSSAISISFRISQRVSTSRSVKLY